MFDLAVEGHGVARIAGELHKECPGGLTGKGWQPGFIRDLLRSRSVLGEYQAHVGTCAKKGTKSTRRPVGEPVKDYFPAIVTEAVFERVQRAFDSRRKGGGRITGTPNLWNGLLYDAADGRRMTVNSCHGRKVLVSSGAVRKQAGSTFRSVRYDEFEEAVLSRLAELKPADVLGQPGAAADRVAVVSGRLTTVNRKLETVRARAAEEDDVSAFLDLLVDLDRQRKALIEELDRAKSDAASQEGDNLGEFMSLAKLLNDALPDQREGLRRKVRAALRRVVVEMRALIVPRPPARLVAVQVWFASGATRDYLILFGQDGGWSPPLSVPHGVGKAPLDLHRPQDVIDLTAALLRLALPQ